MAANITPVTLTPISKPLHLTFTGSKVVLPDNLQRRAEDNWQKRLQASPRLFNGEAFTVTKFDETPEEIHAELAETDYKHVLLSEAEDLGEYAFRVIHAATLVITSDNKLVFGEMNEHTARAGVISCSGGGIDRGDLRGDTIDMDYSAAHEVREELGLDPHNPSTSRFFPAYLKTGGPSGRMTVLYELYTTLTSNEVRKNYEQFIDTLAKKGEDPEYQQIFYLDNTPEAVEAFIKKHGAYLDEYLAALLRITAD